MPAQNIQVISRSWSSNFVFRHQNSLETDAWILSRLGQALYKGDQNHIIFLLQVGKLRHREKYFRMAQQVSIAESKSCWVPAQSSTRYAILPPTGRENPKGKVLDTHHKQRLSSWWWNLGWIWKSEALKSPFQAGWRGYQTLFLTNLTALKLRLFFSPLWISAIFLKAFNIS